jgi:hypothetical protein
LRDDGSDEGQPVGSAEEPQFETSRVTTPGHDSEALSHDSIDAVEAALASALEKATSAERWDLVAQLASELQARRTVRNAPNVIQLSSKGKEGRQR